MSEESVAAIRQHYQFDQYLMHLIQEVSKKPPAEILVFFHELATQVAEMGIKAKKGHGGIHKKITDYFPGTSIPFHMQVKGHKRYQWYDYSVNKYVGGDHYSCDVEVGFPEQRSYMKEEELKNISVLLMEKALLGGEDVVMPDFSKPEIKTPKMYKALMDAFAGREPAPKKPRKKKDDLAGV